MRKMSIITAALLAIFCLSGCSAAIGEECDDLPLVILDCDMGVWNDDALALTMLLKAEEAGRIRILGITLEGGNNFIDADYENYGEMQTASFGNTKQLLESLGREDIPVFRGTDIPQGCSMENIGELAVFYDGLRYLKDSDSYGAVHFFRDLTEGELTDLDEARDFMISCAENYPGRVTVIAIGPTMNIARAVEADDTFAGNIAAIYYMAGAFAEAYGSAYTDGEPVQVVGGANITPFAEYNACYDALSLKICLTAGFPEQYIIPGEINAPVDEDVIQLLEKANAGRSAAANAWLERYAEAVPDYPYWDPVTAAAFLEPDGLNAYEGYVTVNTDRTSPEYAMTVAVTDEEYAGLSDEEKTGYGKAFVGVSYEGFWDAAICLLCR